jgi:hypothetical protein
VLVPLGLAAVMVGVGTAGQRSLERKTAGLIEEMNKTLGSTTAFAGPDTVPAADGNHA